MDPDRRTHVASGALSAGALASFAAWLASPNPFLLVAIVVLASAACATVLPYRRQRPIEPAPGLGTDREDRVRQGSEVPVSPGVSMAGIHLSLETRTRWRERR